MAHQSARLRSESFLCGYVAHHCLTPTTSAQIELCHPVRGLLPDGLRSVVDGQHREVNVLSQYK